MNLIIDNQNRKISLRDSLLVFEIDKTADVLKKHSQQLNLWGLIKVDLSELQEIDSSGIQLLVSLNKTFLHKIIFLNPQEKLKTKLSWHGLKFQKTPDEDHSTP